jgi:hypothetical protein
LTCVAAFNAQTSYDQRFIRDLLPGTDTYKTPALVHLFGVDLNKLDDLPKDKCKLFEEVSPITHLTKDDPPALLIYRRAMDTPITNKNIAIHNPRFGKVLKGKMDALGIECQVRSGVKPASEEWATLTMAFVKRHFGMK